MRPPILDKHLLELMWERFPEIMALDPKATGIEALVCNEIAMRQKMGLAKYQTTVADNPLSLQEWLQHALEESLDQAIYLRRAIAEIDKQSAPKEGQDALP